MTNAYKLIIEDETEEESEEPNEEKTEVNLIHNDSFC